MKLICTWARFNVYGSLTILLYIIHNNDHIYPALTLIDKSPCNIPPYPSLHLFLYTFPVLNRYHMLRYFTVPPTYCSKGNRAFWSLDILTQRHFCPRRFGPTSRYFGHEYAHAFRSSWTKSSRGILSLGAKTCRVKTFGC